jgi:hypothetical protein
MSIVNDIKAVIEEDCIQTPLGDIEAVMSTIYI